MRSQRNIVSKLSATDIAMELRFSSTFVLEMTNKTFLVPIFASTLIWADEWRSSFARITGFWVGKYGRRVELQHVWNKTEFLATFTLGWLQFNDQENSVWQESSQTITWWKNMTCIEIIFRISNGKETSCHPKQIV